MTKDQLKDLFGEKATYEIDAKLNDDELQSKLKKLKSGESITFKADVDDIETDVEAVKNEDGTVTYTANVGGVPKEVNKIADADGKIHYTADFDGSKEWLENNLEKEETITFKADVAGVTQDIQAYKDEDGTIHYYSVLDNGTRKELEQHKNEDGTITYTTTADTSGVEKATKKAKENAEKNKIELEITAKDTNLVDKYIQEKQKSDAAKAKLSDEQAVHGNVDSRDRPMIYWDKENLKSNKSALKSWGQNPKDLKGSYSTVMGGSDEYQGIEIAYTPVLKTGDGKGEVISKNTMSKYINSSEILCKLGKYNTDGIGTISIYAIDSRGNVSDTVKKSFTVLPYSLPRFSVINLKRLNDYESEIVLDFQGVISKLSVNNVEKNTIKTVGYRYAEEGSSYPTNFSVINGVTVSSTPSEYILSFAQNTSDDTFGITGSGSSKLVLDNNKSYNFQFYIRDSFSNEDYYELNIEQGVPTMFIGDNNQVSVGMIPDITRDEKFQVATDILATNANGELVGILDLISKMIIPSDTEPESQPNGGFWLKTSTI